MIRFIRAICVGLTILAGLAGLARTAYAAGVVGNGTPASCTEAALTAALAGGGTVSFNCGGPATILILSEKAINQNTVIQGGGVITLTGGLATRLFRVNSPASLTLNGITLDSAFSNGSDGGAITNSGTLHLENSTIQFSQTDNGHSGGAIFSSGSVFISNSTLKNNTSGNGGAIYSLGSLSIYGVQFIGNSAPQNTPAVGYGGGVASLGMLTLYDSLFSVNLGRFGGGLFVGGNVGNPRADIQRTTFSQNQAGLFGGGLYTNVDTAVITVTDSMFYSNTAVSFGGGIARSNAHLSVLNSSIIQNTATSGGGLHVSAGPSPSVGGYVQVRSVTFSGNEADGNKGGGIANEGGQVELYFTTIVSNTNGVYSTLNGNTRFHSSVLYNPALLNCDGDGTATISNDGANHVSDNSCGPQFTAAGDPKLGPLQDDGPNTTSFHLPLVGSPLINAGAGDCPVRDQRGALRPDACDIGAVEFGSLSLRVYLPLIVK